MTQAVEASKRSTTDMINDCFRHQHPEAYGRPEVAEAVVPSELRYGPAERVPESPIIPETPMGNPEAVPLV